MRATITQAWSSTGLRASTDMKWIHFEPHNRYHAVIGEKAGMAVTFCGRLVHRRFLQEAKELPPSRCRCCVSRIEKPYLIPESLLQLRRDHAA